MIATDKLQFCKGDLLAIAIVMAVAICVLLCFLPQNDQPGYAQIYLNGELVKTVSLQEAQTFAITHQYTNQITVADGKIAITASDCPGRDCVHSGSIQNASRVLVCLPNGLEIRIVAAQGDVDFVVG